MKILSEEESKIELNKIVNHDIFDTKSDAEGIEEISITAFRIKEQVGLNSELNDIILAMEDINHIAKNKNLVVMGVSEYSGFNSAQEVIKSILSDFEENQLSLIESDGILVCFQINPHYPMMKIADAMEIIHNKFNSSNIVNDPYIIFGTSCDNNLKDDYVKATAFMGYSKKVIKSYLNNYIEKSPL